MNCDILYGEHIGKSYGKTDVLNDLSIHIPKGEIYGLVGKNGAGKTTLLRILSGLIPEYSGSISISRECKISTIIGIPALFLNMTAYENMKTQALLLGLYSDDKIREIFDMIGLSQYINKQVRGFSMGMMQRLRIGMGLIDKPDILILDEPLNGLDPDGIVDLRNLLHKLNQESGMTIIISSHILSELEHTATRFGILNGGKIVKELSEKDLYQNGNTLEILHINPNTVLKSYKAVKQEHL